MALQLLKDVVKEVHSVAWVGICGCLDGPYTVCQAIESTVALQLVTMRVMEVHSVAWVGICGCLDGPSTNLFARRSSPHWHCSW